MRCDHEKLQVGRAASRPSMNSNCFVGSTGRIHASMVLILVCGRDWWCESSLGEVRHYCNLGVTAVGKLLAKLGLTPQKPLKRAYECGPAQELPPRLGRTKRTIVSIRRTPICISCSAMARRCATASASGAKVHLGRGRKSIENGSLARLAPAERDD